MKNNFVIDEIPCLNNVFTSLLSLPFTFCDVYWFIQRKTALYCIVPLLMRIGNNQYSIYHSCLCHISTGILNDKSFVMESVEDAGESLLIDGQTTGELRQFHKVYSAVILTPGKVVSSKPEGHFPQANRCLYRKGTHDKSKNLEPSYPPFHNIHFHPQISSTAHSYYSFLWLTQPHLWLTM